MSGGRWVVDTNVLVSALISFQSAPGQAAQAALHQGEVLFSVETLGELSQVLKRPKFDRICDPPVRARFVELISLRASFVEIHRPIRACRDPKDDAILSVAVNGQADAIISGDADLLALHPFHGIPILSPRDFLDRLQGL